jgi:magnesium-transporting ATPase (P-type)
MQAVNAADFAIAQFEYLATLMLKHGRYNYIRMSNLICYMFYKNVFMSVGQFWLNFNSGFSGQKFYFEFGIQFFNLIFTSIPILVAATFDMDVLPSSIFKYRQLYQGTVKSANFNVITITITLLIHSYLSY